MNTKDHAVSAERALDLALEALEEPGLLWRSKKAIAAIKQARSAPYVQEPVGEVSGHDWSTGLLYRDLEPGTPLYTAPCATPAQMPATPEGWSLVAVKGFDDLTYWLDRCEEKGHLENCPDLIEPYQAFEYQPVTTPPAAQRQRVVFPTMLCKMWSGGEVQAWLDKNVNKENT